MSNLIHQPHWGPWHYDPSLLTIECLERGYSTYPIDLETCTHTGVVLDWIAQIERKLWASDDVLAGLIRCLDDLLDLQAHFCGFGRNLSHIHPKSILKHFKLAPLGDDRA